MPQRRKQENIEGRLFPVETMENNIYLVEEKENNEEIAEWLKKNFDYVFKKELESRNADEKLWPKKRTYEMFNEWFSVSYHSMIYDLENYPVDKDMN